MGGETRHPILVDTDALIAVANTQLWPAVTETLTLTTTNVCLQELTRHVHETSEYAADGTRDHWVYAASDTARGPFEDDSNQAFTVVPSVPVRMAKMLVKNPCGVKSPSTQRNTRTRS